MPSTPRPQPAFSPLQIPYPYPPTVIFNEQDKINQSINVEQSIWKRLLKIFVTGGLTSYLITEVLSLVESVLRKPKRPVPEVLHLAKSELNYQNAIGFIVNMYNFDSTKNLCVENNTDATTKWWLWTDNKLAQYILNKVSFTAIATSI